MCVNLRLQVGVWIERMAGWCDHVCVCNDCIISRGGAVRTACIIKIVLGAIHVSTTESSGRRNASLSEVSTRSIGGNKIPERNMLPAMTDTRLPYIC